MRYFICLMVLLFPLSFVNGAEMSDHVFVFSEWLAEEGHDHELWVMAKKIMAQTLEEKGCVRAHALRQIAHPGAPGKSRYTIVLHQEYVDKEAFDIHCASDYVSHFFKTYVENPDTKIVKEWRCRLFSENGKESDVSCQ